MKRTYRRSFDSWLTEQQGVLPKTTLRYIIEAFIPYSEANLKLAFKPNAFFDEIEKIDNRRYSRESLRKAYYEARRKGFIHQDSDGSVILSDKAKMMIRPYKPKKLIGASLMVVFDIPEEESYKRRWFRLLLRELKFKKVQQSVWVSEFDCAEVLSAGILEQQLENCVRVYEARAIESLPK